RRASLRCRATRRGGPGSRRRGKGRPSRWRSAPTRRGPSRGRGGAGGPRGGANAPQARGGPGEAGHAIPPLSRAPDHRVAGERWGGGGRGGGGGAGATPHGKPIELHRGGDAGS